MIRFRHSGNFDNTERFFRKGARRIHLRRLQELGALGVQALASATPQATGETAASWSYEIWHTPKSGNLIWTNSKTTVEGVPIIILLQYGHATGRGGFVQGQDFINPAIRPVMDRIVEEIWREVRGL